MSTPRKSKKPVGGNACGAMLVVPGGGGIATVWLVVAASGRGSGVPGTGAGGGTVAGGGAVLATAPGTTATLVPGAVNARGRTGGTGAATVAGAGVVTLGAPISTGGGLGTMARRSAFPRGSRGLGWGLAGAGPAGITGTVGGGAWAGRSRHVRSKTLNCKLKIENFVFTCVWGLGFQV